MRVDLGVGSPGPPGRRGDPGITANFLGDYDPARSYSAGPPPDAVLGSDGQFYYSLVTPNLGHNPVGDGGVHWASGLGVSVVSVSSNPAYYDVVSPLPTGVAATDTANLQAFLSAIPPNGSGFLRGKETQPWIITAGVVKYPTSTTSEGTYGSRIIYSNAAVLAAAAGSTGALVGDAVPPNLTALENNRERNFHWHNVKWIGDGTPGQVGYQPIGQHHSTMHNCEFFDLDTRSDYISCEICAEYNCVGTNNVTYGRRVRSAAGVVTGATDDNSGSNQFSSIGDRDYALAGMTAQYSYEASDGCVMYGPTTEGADPVNDILLNGHNSTVVKTFVVGAVWHNENGPTGAGLKIQNFSGGGVGVGKTFYQVPQTLIDATGVPPETTIVVEDLIYVRTEVAPFKADTSGGAASWLLRGKFPSDFYGHNPALWSSGVPVGMSDDIQTGIALSFDGITWASAGGVGRLLSAAAFLQLVGSRVQITAKTSGGLVEVGPNVAIGLPTDEDVNPTTLAALAPSSLYPYHLESTGKIHEIVTEAGGTQYDITRPYKSAGRPLLATGAGHTVDDVITALQTLLLVRQS